MCWILVLSFTWYSTGPCPPCLFSLVQRIRFVGVEHMHKYYLIKVPCQQHKFCIEIETEVFHSCYCSCFRWEFLHKNHAINHCYQHNEALVVQLVPQYQWLMSSVGFLQTVCKVEVRHLEQIGIVVWEWTQSCLLHMVGQFPDWTSLRSLIFHTNLLFLSSPLLCLWAWPLSFWHQTNTFYYSLSSLVQTDWQFHWSFHQHTLHTIVGQCCQCLGFVIHALVVHMHAWSSSE